MENEQKTAGEAIDREAAQSLLEEAREAQTAFWTALRLLEECIGCDVDSTCNLEEAELDDLLEVQPAYEGCAPGCVNDNHAPDCRYANHQTEASE